MNYEEREERKITTLTLVQKKISDNFIIIFQYESLALKSSKNIISMSKNLS